MFSLTLISLSVCLFTGLCKRYSTDFFLQTFGGKTVSSWAAE